MVRLPAAPRSRAQPDGEVYGLSGVEEARAYLAHPLLGERLRRCCGAILPQLKSMPAAEILGPIDALKLGSSMEIFAEANPSEPLFRQLLAAMF